MPNKKLLWISQYVPYDSVAHAGGQVENYYIKSINKTKKFDILLYTFANKFEKSKIDLDKYNISHNIKYYTWTGVKGQTLKLVNRFSKAWVFRKHGGLSCIFFPINMIKRIKELAKTGYVPDIVVLQWTEMVLINDEIKKIFPKAKVVCIEEDVSFLSIERYKNASNNFFVKAFFAVKYKTVKKAELKAINLADLTIFSNRKDETLARCHGFSGNSFIECPYYNNMLEIERKKTNKDILYFGAMSRKENWKSAIWFIENVMPLIDDTEIRFVIVGSNPDYRLKELESDNVKIVGFVENIKPYFQNSLCMVAPLVLGAGVKVKILEALSSGIPVLTNSIGIEGIDAQNNVHYFHCENPSEYIEIINKLLNNSINTQEVSQNAKAFIKRNYDLKKTTEDFCERFLFL